MQRLPLYDIRLQFHTMIFNKIVSHRSDFQPAVRGRQKQVGCVVGVRQLQHSLFKTSLMSEKKCLYVG